MSAVMKVQHKMLLQGIISRKVLKEDEIVELMTICLTNSAMPVHAKRELKDLEQMLGVINANIRPLHMGIKKGVSESDGCKYYVLVNTSESHVALLASDYTVTELEYFKKVLEKIVLDSNNGSISSTTTLNLVDDLERRLSKKDAQDLLQRWFDDKWLTENNGAIALHVRGVIELDHFLKEMYPNDVVHCALCKQLVMQGKNCFKCDVKLHNHCYARLQKDCDTIKCPRCKVTWPAT